MTGEIITIERHPATPQRHDGITLTLRNGETIDIIIEGAEIAEWGFETARPILGRSAFRAFFGEWKRALRIKIKAGA